VYQTDSRTARGTDFTRANAALNYVAWPGRPLFAGHKPLSATIISALLDAGTKKDTRTDRQTDRQKCHGKIVRCILQSYGKKAVKRISFGVSVQSVADFMQGVATQTHCYR